MVTKRFETCVKGALSAFFILFLVTGSQARAARFCAQYVSDSGAVFNRLAKTAFADRDFPGALSLFERGIETDPTFPDNYYWASKMYLSSSEPVWGMIYGEIFMNLLPGSDSARSMSRLIYDGYSRHIQLDKGLHVDFCSTAFLTLSDTSSMADIDREKLPFEVGVYEFLTLKALEKEGDAGIEGLCKMRQDFIVSYFAEGYQHKYPNVLFDFEYLAYQAGCLNAYNHWVLTTGKPKALARWQKRHRAEWEGFVNWSSRHALHLSEDYSFSSGQYETVIGLKNTEIYPDVKKFRF